MVAEAIQESDEIDCHRDRAGKIRLRAVQTWGTAQGLWCWQDKISALGRLILLPDQPVSYRFYMRGRNDHYAEFLGIPACHLK